MTSASPVRRVLVGGALRRYREGVGYSLEDAAQVVAGRAAAVSEDRKSVV